MSDRPCEPKLLDGGSEDRTVPLTTKSSFANLRSWLETERSPSGPGRDRAALRFRSGDMLPVTADATPTTRSGTIPDFHSAAPTFEELNWICRSTVDHRSAEESRPSSVRRRPVGRRLRMASHCSIAARGGRAGIGLRRAAQGRLTGRRRSVSDDAPVSFALAADMRLACR
jgi:hypothetical protein